MVSLTALAPWILLMIINHGVPLLLMKMAITYQVEAIMEIVDQNAQMQHVVQINFNANQEFANILITVTVMARVFQAVG